MKLKYIGKISNINPTDSEIVVNTIKNLLDSMFNVNISKKNSLYKTLKYINFKTSIKNETNKFLEEKIFYSNENMADSLSIELFDIMKNNISFKNISNFWIENYNNPVYLVKTSNVIERKNLTPKQICESQIEGFKTNIDMLIYGDIERIDNINIINIYIYSYYDDKNIMQFTIVSDSENIIKNTNDKFKSILPDLFLINYSTLIFKSENENQNEEISIFINNKYIGKNQTKVEFLVPGKYIVKFLKNNYEEKIENVTLLPSEKKELKISIGNKKELQVINFNIEPFGTKIFLNSIYKGKTPFKIGLPKGQYIISAKNDLYEDFRYLLIINDISGDEKNFIFHLKSANIVSSLKLKRLLYYTSFWNFTFSLTVSIPTLIFAYNFFYTYGTAQDLYNQKFNIVSLSDKQYNTTEEGKKLETIKFTLFAFAGFMLTYTGLSLGWLFYSLFDYLKLLDKKDFIPILDFYRNKDGNDIILIGTEIKINK